MERKQLFPQWIGSLWMLLVQKPAEAYSISRFKMRLDKSAENRAVNGC